MVTKEEAKERISKLIKEFSEIPKEYIDDKSENQIKSEFIDPLFEALGWDMRKDAERETHILKGRADYIMKIANQENLVIEAKKTSVSLGEEEGKQAVSYAYHRKIKFAVLTNFKYIRVYHALSNIQKVDRSLLFWLDFRDFDKNFDKLWLLSRESFEKKEIDKLIPSKDQKTAIPIDERILEDLLQIRKWLSTELKSKRMELKDEYIDEIVQIAIDRLIFMRSVEDRGLEGDEFLLKIVDDVHKGLTEKNLWALLKEQFTRFDNTYNSKLFTKGILEEYGVFSDETLKKVIKTLYHGLEHNQEKYMFNEIPGDLFGNIYEQYLGTILAGTEKRVKLDSGSGKRKKMGIYYTPSYIVDYIVKNTVGEYIKNKTIDEILEVNIVDPACGSGSFLIRAFKEVCEVIEIKLKNGEKSQKWSSFKEYKEDLSFAQKSTILKNCIYGVDLDEKAVELAQLNLLLKCLEGESRELKNRKLPNLLDNIKNGNSLIDDPKVAGDKAFNWNAQFKDVFDNGGFDIVIGNPPYGLVFNEKEKTKIEDLLPTFKRNNDLYVAFIERGTRILKSKGLFSYIVPNTYILGDYFESLRGFLLKEGDILKVIDFTNNEIFKDPNVFNSIILFIKQNLEEKNDIAFLSIPYFDNLESLNIENIAIKIKINQSSLTSSSWRPKNEVIIKIEDSKDFLLGEKFDVKDVGFNYWSIGRGKVRGDSIGSRILYEGEKNNQKDTPYLKGRDLDRYFLKFGNHFLKNDYEKYLDKKKDVFRFSKEFLEISPKLIYRQTADKIIATIDEHKFYLDKTVHLIVPREKIDIGLKAILAILNSKVMHYFYSNLVGETGRTFAQVKTIYMKKIPIRLPPPAQEKKIVDLVNQMLELQKRYHDEKIAGGEKERMKQQIGSIDYEIDQEVYKLYGLTVEEIKIVEESLK